MKKLFLSFLIVLLFGCKSAPQETPPEPEAPPEPNILTQDEIDVIDEVINHLITYELKNIKGDMQVCINSAFFVHRMNYSDSYEDDLKKSEHRLKNEMTIDDRVISSYIQRNIKRRNIEKNDYFKADFFWNGGTPRIPYFRTLFSNIGFDETRTKALLYVYVDLPGWMFAEYVYLEKRNGKWAFNKCLLAWLT